VRIAALGSSGLPAPVPVIARELDATAVYLLVTGSMAYVFVPVHVTSVGHKA
jgi:hypothetical protein